MTEKNDGYINWVEPKNLGFLPPDIEKDSLSVMLRLLIAKVKEDHARYQYRRDLKHYAREIIEIVRFAKTNGYKTSIYNNKSNQSSQVKTNIDNLELLKNTTSIIEDVDFVGSADKKNRKEIVDG